MKVPPVKPHFFKPILPGFKHGLKIPVGFLKYLKGHNEQEHVILKRAGKKWLVKLNGQRLEEGWGKFAEEHDLQLGDLLIFRHEGDMEFDVSIFNLSHCDREYAEYLQEERAGGGAHTVKETSKKFGPKEAATHNPVGQSQFVCTVKQYCLSNGYLRIPNKFAFANGLTNKECGLIIRDERQRSWNLRIYTSCSQVYIGGRWGEFRAANDLKVGDQILFEVVTNGEQPIWKFHDKTNPSIKALSKALPYAEAAAHKPFGLSLFDSSHCDTEYAEYLQEEEEDGGGGAHIVEETSKNFEFEGKPNPTIKSSSKAFPHVEAATHKPSGQSRFVCTIRPYCLTYGYLCLPKQFALRNGLISKKCNLIIRDEWQRSWNLILRPFGSSVCIRGGWDKFRDTYFLKEGDRIMFEVVTDGEKPIWKFHGKISGEEDVSIIEQ